MSDAAANDLITDFVDESLQSLRGLADQLTLFQQQPQVEEPIHAVFRAIHSIKGCAGFLDLAAIKKFSHALENTLDDVRKGKLPLTEDLCRAIIEGFDVIDAMLQRVGEQQIDDALKDNERALLDRIAQLTSAPTSSAQDDPELMLLMELQQLSEEIAAAALPQSKTWSERLQKLATACTENSDAANSPENQQQESQGNLATSDQSKWPAAAGFLTYKLIQNNIDITPKIHELLDVFVAMQQGKYTRNHGNRFLEQAEALTNWATEQQQNSLADALQAAAQDFRTIHNSPLDMDSSLIALIWDKLAPELCNWVEGGVPSASVSAATNDSSGDQPSGPATNEVAKSTPKAAANKPEPATTNNKSDSAAKSAAPNKSRYVRVREEKLDEFLTHVSSLFITCELYKDIYTRLTDTQAVPALVEEIRQINRAFIKQTAHLQKGVLSLRRVTAASLFSKFPTMARTLAAQLHKKVDVQLLGEDVEIDKSLVEDLDSPLTHMIRNVMDHGIETPGDRAANGKSEIGSLIIRAELSKTHVIITVQDDGRGIDPNRLRRKVVEKGLMTEAQANALADQEAVELIFMAGLSTAEKISEISGRGVGLDVVRTKLKEYNGDVIVESQLGKGTKFRLELPLREAVVVANGLLVKHDDETLVLPLEYVREITSIRYSELRSSQGMKIVAIRGKLFHTLSLSEVLGTTARSYEPDEEITIVQVAGKNCECCFIVDTILAHRQVVVNSLRDVVPVSEKIAGVAQLGGNRLAIVLSIPDILKSLS